MVRLLRSEFEPPLLSFVWWHISSQELNVVGSLISWMCSWDAQYCMVNSLKASFHILYMPFTFQLSFLIKETGILNCRLYQLTGDQGRRRLEMSYCVHRMTSHVNCLLPPFLSLTKGITQCMIFIYYLPIFYASWNSV